MNGSRCPYCRVPLGDFLYADLCPNCASELERNRADPLPPAAVHKDPVWPMRIFKRVVRFIES